MLKEKRLTIVGAGPGDEDLITLKGIKALEKADVVLYDALVHPGLLRYAPDAEHIFVGKRKGCYAFHQDQINELIVSRASTHGHVVRLKGGDPFVFGRGSEEMAYAASRGIEVASIPGISSCIAVPGAQNIPVTQRGVSESFWVITATTREHELSRDIRLAARSTATVVILMGMGKITQIVEIFRKLGKSDIPVAIIQEGTLKSEKVGIGTIGNILEVVSDEKLTNPAVIIIGEVVRHRKIMGEIKGQLQTQILC